MVTFPIRLLSVAVVASHLLNHVACVPVVDVTSSRNASLVELETSATTAAPHWVIYSNQWVSGETGPPDPSAVKGFNTFILSFLLTSGAADQALEWQSISASDRSAIKSQYAAAGIKLLVSVFGATDAPTTAGSNPTTLADTMAAWVKKYDLDGIDVDYEDFNAFDGSSGLAVTWLKTFTKQLRVHLPQGSYILTHAPVAPWFQSDGWSGGGYLAIDQAVGSLIDWYNVQFYNQGGSMYTTCTGLLTKSGGAFPGSSVFEIHANGVSLDKIVIGKPAIKSDASNGYMSPTTLATCLVTAKNNGWNAGIMTWEFPNAQASWISAVRSKVFA
ncbi:glycoside hydrolase [Lactarius psammicola]|nr:glycoside hydrolase [Lactarius psammicola]